MNVDHRDTYLESQIRTATPQRLRLMLIEGALRFARQADGAWTEPLEAAPMESLRRCRAILAELHGSVRTDTLEVASRVADLYFFLYRQIVVAQADEDRQALADVIRVLEEERTTWQLVCEQLPEAPVSSGGGPEEITASDCAGTPVDPTAAPPAESFQLDA